MSWRRWAAGAVLLAVLAVSAGILLLGAASGGERRDYWVLTGDMVAGQAIAGSDVSLQVLQVRDGGPRPRLLERSPAGRRLARSLPAGTPLRPDDLLERDMVQVPVQFVAPPLRTGDRVDVYEITDRAVVLRGASLVVTAVPGSGGMGALLVPASEEATWVALAAGSSQLRATVTYGAPPPTSAPLIRPVSPGGAASRSGAAPGPNG